LTYQWQSSPNGTTGWTDMPGATTSFYSTSQAVSTYYRCVVTCSSTSGGSATSNSVLVTSPTLVSGTFTIDKTAPTPLPPNTFLSFNDAYSYIKCGINGPVIFNVAAGGTPYVEQLIMTPVPGASAITPLLSMAMAIPSPLQAPALKGPS
jgi:trimeric autotransporter adhesin